jgi:hypothetical protein
LYLTINILGRREVKPVAAKSHLPQPQHQPVLRAGRGLPALDAKTNRAD